MAEIATPEAGADDVTIVVVDTIATRIAMAQQFNTMGNIVNERDAFGAKAW